MPRHDGLILAIETSNPGAGPAGVAVARAAHAHDVTIVETLHPAHRHDDGLMPAIDRAVRRAGGTPDAIVRIAVSCGPGGYTALRVACVTAVALAEAAGAEAVPVPTAAVARTGAAGITGACAVALASKDDRAHVTAFPAGWRPGDAVPDGTLIDADALDPVTMPVLLADAHLPAAFSLAAARLAIRIQPITLDPASCLSAGILMPAVDPAHIRPIYPREPDAVTLWRKHRPNRPAQTDV